MIALKLYSAWYCPFAQRAWMTLLHKGLPFEYIEVDPYRESDWWLNLSRNRSTVPVIVTSENNGQAPTTVVDSTRVVEYLDELSPGDAPLFSSDLNTRAEQRFWVDHINERIVPPLYQLLAADRPGEDRDNCRDKLVSGLQTLAEAMSSDGRYFAGDTLTAIDLLMIPFAYRIDALLSHYRDFSVPTKGDSWANYARWYDHMCSLEPFKGTATDHDDYRHRLIEHYLPYSRGETH